MSKSIGPPRQNTLGNKFIGEDAHTSIWASVFFPLAGTENTSFPLAGHLPVAGSLPAMLLPLSSPFTRRAILMPLVLDQEWVKGKESERDSKREQIISVRSDVEACYKC